MEAKTKELQQLFNHKVQFQKNPEFEIPVNIQHLQNELIIILLRSDVDVSEAKIEFNVVNPNGTLSSPGYNDLKIEDQYIQGDRMIGYLMLNSPGDYLIKIKVQDFPIILDDSEQTIIFNPTMMNVEAMIVMGIKIVGIIAILLATLFISALGFYLNKTKQKED